MSADDAKRTFRNELLLASALVATGLVIVVLSLHEIHATAGQQTAQATPPTQSTPSPTPTNKAPAESTPGGDRPTTPPPQPARPDSDAQNSGARPALPPAPAEKSAPPIKERQ